MNPLRVAITGGTSGLGLALVREFRRRGARVALVARTASAVAEVARTHRAHGVVGDVARKEEIHPIALQITAALGGLDVLINNASSLGPVPSRCSPTASVRISRSRSRRTCLAHSASRKRCSAHLPRLRARARRRGAQRLERCGDQCLRAMGCLWCFEGGATPLERDLERGARRGGRAFPLARPGRHGHAAARPCCTGRRSGDAQEARSRGRELADAVVDALAKEHA